jgi:hypothetical protein
MLIVIQVSCFCQVLFRSSHTLSDYMLVVMQCIAKLLHHTESNDISMFPLTVDMYILSLSLPFLLFCMQGHCGDYGCRVALIAICVNS